MDNFLRDLRYAWRGLRRTRAFTVAAVATLALGIGANTAIFSMVNGVLIEALPFGDADRLAMVWLDNTRLGVRTDITSYPNFEDMREQSRAFSGLAGFAQGAVNLTGDFEPERVSLATTTADFFRVVGVDPARGRVFTEGETRGGGARVALISHGVWERRYGADPGAVGRTIDLNDAAYTVIGVMPDGFAFPGTAQIWTPLAPSEGGAQRAQRVLAVRGRQGSAGRDSDRGANRDGRDRRAARGGRPAARGLRHLRAAYP